MDENYMGTQLEKFDISENANEISTLGLEFYFEQGLLVLIQSDMAENTINVNKWTFELSDHKKQALMIQIVNFYNNIIKFYHHEITVNTMNR